MFIMYYYVSDDFCDTVCKLRDISSGLRISVRVARRHSMRIFWPIIDVIHIANQSELTIEFGHTWNQFGSKIDRCAVTLICDINVCETFV